MTVITNRGNIGQARRGMPVPVIPFNIILNRKVWLDSGRDDTAYWFGQIREALTVPTGDGLVYHMHGPSLTPNDMGVPRGFLKFLLSVFDEAEVAWNLSDERTSVPAEFTKFPINMSTRPHQPPAVEAITYNEDGILVAPPGAGKTVIVLEAIRQVGERALIIVDKLQIMDQWRDRAQQFLGVDAYCIGGGYGTVEGAFDSDAPIVIGMQQTLSKSTSVLSDQFGFVCLDECHHVPANTYMEVFSNFASKYRIGVSATPTREDGLEKLAYFGIGPIIHTITDEELEDTEFMVKPTVAVVPTGWEHPFWSDHFATKDQTCQVPNCKKNGTAHGHRNNYAKVIKALAEDPERNKIIARRVMMNRNDCNLVVSDRLGQLDAIREAVIQQGFPESRVHMLTGRESASERATITRQAGYGECVILSTIAKEALDIPRLDRLYLAWPMKKTHILHQQIGRITRAHPDKAFALVYDFQDRCSVLMNQARQRNIYYNSKKLEVRNA